MESVAWVTYRHMRKELNDIVRCLYDCVYALVSADISYCSDFDRPHKTLIGLFNIACRLLRHSELSKSAPLCIFLLFRIEGRGFRVLRNYINIHNMSLKNMDHDVLKQLLSSARREINRDAKGIKQFCSRLIRTSDFIQPNFLLVAVVVGMIEFFFNQMQGSTIIDAERKQRSIIGNGQQPFTIGIVSTSPVVWRGCSSINMRNFNADIYIETIRHYIQYSSIVNTYNTFLLEGLQERYKCSFEDLMLCLADESLARPDRNLFDGEVQVVVSDGKVRMVNDLPIKKARRARRISSVESTSSILLHTSNQMVLSVEGADSQINQVENCVVCSSNTTGFDVMRPCL